jgi:hypothetical protein
MHEDHPEKGEASQDVEGRNSIRCAGDRLNFGGGMLVHGGIRSTGQGIWL